MAPGLSPARLAAHEAVRAARLLHGELAARGLIAVLRDFAVYCDESGAAHDQRVVAMAGYISTGREWAKFAHEWTAALHPFRDRVPYFHMTEFASGKGMFRDRDYWTPEREQALIVPLVRAIRRRAMFGVLAGVYVKDYDEVLSDKLKERFGGPYLFCMETVILKVQRWLNEEITNKAQERIAFIFDQNTHMERDAREAYRIIKERNDPHDLMGPVQFDDKRKAVQLQAPDILAHQHFQHLRDNKYQVDLTRNVLRWIVTGVRTDMGFYDRAQLAALQDEIERRDLTG